MASIVYDPEVLPLLLVTILIYQKGYLNFMDAGSRILRGICMSEKTSLSVYKLVVGIIPNGQSGL